MHKGILSFREQVTVVQNSFINTIGFFRNVALLEVYAAGDVGAAEDIHAADTVVGIEGGCRGVAFFPAQGLCVRSVKVKAEAFPLMLDGADAHDGTYGGVVLGAGIVDNLDALDLVAGQTVQFRDVGNFASVDVHQRGALPNHFQPVLPLDDTGSPCQHIVGRSRILQHGTVHMGLQAFARHFGLGHNGGHGRAFQHGGVVLKRDDHPVHRSNETSLVAQHGHHHDSVIFLCNNIENTAFIGNGTADDGRIGLGEHSHIGIGNRGSVLIHHLSFPILLREGS